MKNSLVAKILLLVVALAPAIVDPGNVRGQSQSVHVRGALFDSTIEVTTRPDSTVLAELWSDDGVRKGVATAVASAEGRAQLTLRNESSLESVALLPGDRLRVSPGGDLESTERTVPMLSGYLSLDAHAIYGVTDLESGAAWQVLDENEHLVGEGAIGNAGEFQVDLAQIQPIRHGQIGRLVATSDSQYEWSAWIAAPQLILNRGHAINGRASAGSVVTVSRQGVSQDEEIGRVVVRGGTSWQFHRPYNGVDEGGGEIVVDIKPYGMERVFSLEAMEPAINVEVFEGNALIRGMGHPNGSVVIDVYSNEKVIDSFTVECDERGVFQRNYPHVDELVLGWRVEATIDENNGIVFRSSDSAQGVSVQLWGRSIEGRLPVLEAAVTLNVSDLSGRVLHSHTLLTGRDGAMSGSWDASSGDRLRGGQYLSLDWGTGDPVYFRLPVLHIAADASASRLVGTFDSTSPIYVLDSDKVVISGPHFSSVSGELSIEVGPGEGIQSDDHGFVMAQLNSGHRVFVPWAVPRPTLDGSKSSANGICAPVDDVILELVSIVGAVVDTVRVSCGDSAGISSRGFWRWEGHDSSGLSVSWKKLGSIRISAGTAQPIEARLPEVSGYVDVEHDTFSGTVLPIGVVSMRLSRGRDRATVALSLNENGAIDAAFGDKWDARIGDDAAALRVEYDNYEFETLIAIPRLVVDLDTGRVQGDMESNELPEVHLKREGEHIGTGVLGVDPDGGFVGVFADVNGTLIVPTRGDQVVMTGSVPGSGTYSRFDFVVPHFTLETQTISPQVSGAAESGGHVRIVVRTSYHDGTPGVSGLASPGISTEGRYSAEFNPPLAFLPGQLISGYYVGDDGLTVMRQSREPFFSLQYPGDLACGVAQPGDVVQMELRPQDEDEWVAGSPQVVGVDGEFELAWWSESARPNPGDSLRFLRNGSVESVFRIPELHVEFHWPESEIQVLGPPSTSWYVDRPMDGCQTARSIGGGVATQRIQADAAGAFQAFVSPRRGESVQLWHMLDNGYRLYRPIVRNRFRAFIDQDDVRGRVSPNTPISATVYAAGGAIEAVGETTSNVDGAYELRLHDLSGRPYTVNDSGALVVHAEGDSARLDLMDVRFDYSEGVGLFGRAPSAEEVAIELSLADGRVAVFYVQVDESGHYALRSDDIPRSADWAFRDVRTIQAVVSRDLGIEFAARAVLNIPDRARVWIPFILSRY